MREDDDEVDSSLSLFLFFPVVIHGRKKNKEAASLLIQPEAYPHVWLGKNDEGG